jgi:hypothetical protein
LRPQNPLAALRRVPASKDQEGMIYAVSMRKAEELLDECSAHDRPLKHQTAYALAGSIRAHARDACAIDRQAKLCADEVDPIKDAIKRAVVDHEGDTVIESKEF